MKTSVIIVLIIIGGISPLIIFQIYANYNERAQSIEPTPTIENYPGDSVFFVYCLENQITEGIEGEKCFELIQKSTNEHRGIKKLELDDSCVFRECTLEELREEFEELSKEIQEHNRIIDYINKFNREG